MPYNDGQSTLYFGPWYRKSPFFEATQRAGAKAYDIYNHMYLPGLYTDPFEEYWHLINHVTLWDVSVERQVEISGRDGAKFAELITPRDLTKCDVGQGKYVVITDENGGIINDPVLIRLEKNRFWLSLANSDTLLWAKGVAVNSGMDVDISEPDVSPLQVQGPDSKNVLKDLVGPAVLDLGYYYFMNAKIDGIPVVITRTGWTAEVGYEVYLTDGRRGVELWDRIMEAGKKYEIRPIAPWEIRRSEGGIRNYGSDMTLENNPYEVSLSWLVDLNKKADFIGKKALAKIKKEGVKRKLVGLEIDGPQIHAWATEFWDVKKDGKKVGHLTALTYSPRLEVNIAYAWVPIRLAKLGTRLTIATSAGARDATVVKQPFVDPKKSTPNHRSRPASFAARDEYRLRGHELVLDDEPDRVGDLPRRRHAAEGDARHSLGKVRQPLPDDLRVREARRDAGDADAGPCHLEAERPREAEEGRLRGGVVDAAGAGRPYRDERGDVHDDAPPPFDHAREHLADHIERAEDVDTENGLPIVRLHLHHGPESENPGVVHQDVHPAEPVCGGANNAAARFKVADVAWGDMDAARRTQGIGNGKERLGFLSGVEDDLRAGVRQHGGGRMPDPTRRARDDGDGTSDFHRPFTQPSSRS